jgi:hypothetical protein
MAARLFRNGPLRLIGVQSMYKTTPEGAYGYPTTYERLNYYYEEFVRQNIEF